MGSLMMIAALCFTFTFTAESKTHWEDIETLKALKQSIDPNSVTPGSCVSSWDLTLDPCDNLSGEKFTCGFRCDAVVSGFQRVTELSLDQAGYSGSLTSLPWNLPYLETLDLSNNFFSGQIPNSFGNLTRLSRLGLSTNSFSGEIPDSVGSLENLEELYLDHNNLEGSIPDSFNNLVNLQRLELQSNKLNGYFPNFDTDKVKQLNYLDLSDNFISGALPAWLPVSLVQISIRNNNLTGELNYKSFRNLMELQVVDFSYNQLSGSVPSILLEIPSLQQLSLSFNQLSRIEAPSSLGGLIAVDMSNNKLGGVLPSFMALMPRLTSLSLENNEFSGLIPMELAVKTVFPEEGISALSRLLLGGNYLLGGIPRPLLMLKPDDANVSLVDNCLFRCPHTFFFCQGGRQKSFHHCKRFIP